MVKKTKALKKRQQIDKAGRNMFTVVAITSFVTGFAIVAAVFIISKMLFNVRVISEKNKTYDVLLENNKNIVKLAEQVRALEIDESLVSARLDDTEQSFQVILDALPAVGNSTALGASLRDKILSVPGVIVDNLTVNPTSEESTSGEFSQEALSNDDSIPILFNFKVIGRVGDVSQVLKNMEKSIRPIMVDVVRFEVSTGDDAQSSLVVQGRSFYEPMLEAKLKNKKIESGK